MSLAFNFWWRPSFDSQSHEQPLNYLWNTNNFVVAANLDYISYVVRFMHERKTKYLFNIITSINVKKSENFSALSRNHSQIEQFSSLSSAYQILVQRMYFWQRRCIFADRILQESVAQGILIQSHSQHLHVFRFCRNSLQEQNVIS